MCLFIFRFSWLFKLCFLVLVPIALICTYLKISHSHEIKNIEFDPLDSVRERHNQITRQDKLIN